MFFRLLEFHFPKLVYFENLKRSFSCKKMMFFLSFYYTLYSIHDQCPNYKETSLHEEHINPLRANPTKWSNTLKQFVSFFLSVFDHFVGLTLKGLIVNGLRNFEKFFFKTKNYRKQSTIICCLIIFIAL